jgi:hypothetical protein
MSEDYRFAAKIIAERDALAAELSGYKESHEKYCPSAARVRELEALVKTLLAPAANGIVWHIRARELEAKLNQIVTCASYRCEESVETLEAAMAFITKTAREALAPKEKV